MAPVLTEGLPHAEGMIVSEAQGSLSREQVTIVEAPDELVGGTVMGERADGKWAQLDPAATEGNEVAKGVLLRDVDPSGGDVLGVVIERLAEVRGSDLTWPEGITTGEQDAAVAQLLERNIKIRVLDPAVITTQTT